MREAFPPLFGTDGIRGKAFSFPLIPPVISKIAQAVAQTLCAPDTSSPTVIIGTDTRVSCPLIADALSQGLIPLGIRIQFVGILPTPAVAFLVRHWKADFGIMISASHNPYEDNGLKFFGPEGGKLTQEQQISIEEKVHTLLRLSKDQETEESPTSRSFLDSALDSQGEGHSLHEQAQAEYIQFLLASLPPAFHLKGLHLVLDCANGAAFEVAPRLFRQLGAQISLLGAAPNGTNINACCGSTSPQALQRAVQSEKAHGGIALDGDADRLLMVTAKGELLDGDQLLALLVAYSEDRSGEENREEGYKHFPIVGTHMSNGGLETYLSQRGKSLIRVPVGDRFVQEAMKKEGALLGGEPSGHLILRAYSDQGDGLLAALHILKSVLKGRRRSRDPSPSSSPWLFHSSEDPNQRALLFEERFAPVFSPFPHLLWNMKGVDRHLLESPPVQKSLQKAQSFLEDRGGRLLVRFSGTEPVLRVMVEAPLDKDMREAFEQIREALERKALKNR